MGFRFLLIRLFSNRDEELILSFVDMLYIYRTRYYIYAEFFFYDNNLRLNYVSLSIIYYITVVVLQFCDDFKKKPTSVTRPFPDHLRGFPPSRSGSRR